MKRIFTTVLLLSALLLTGCFQNDRSDPLETSNTQSGISDQASSDAVARIAYYEELVAALQEEVLAMKAELFATKTEYEKRIAELEASKEEQTKNDDFTYTVSSNGVTVIGYKGDALSVQIPSMIDGRPVIAIGDRAFSGNTKVQSVTVPDGVVTVGWFAFSGCVSLGAVTLPASVSSISYGTFENCPSSLTVFCPAGSYAQKYAQSYGIATVG